ARRRSRNRAAACCSAGERRLPADPGARGLDLRREPEERRLVAETAYELHRERQASRRTRRLGLPHREHDCRLTRDVEPHGEWGERKYPPPILIHVFQHHVDPPELDRARRRQPRSEEDVMLLVEG